MRMRWAGHAARMMDRRKAYTFLSKILKEIFHLEDLGIDWMIKLNWT
jgi:hypothetical protein